MFQVDIFFKQEAGVFAVSHKQLICFLSWSQMIFTLGLLRFEALKQSVSTTAAMLVQEEPCGKRVFLLPCLKIQSDFFVSPLRNQTAAAWIFCFCSEARFCDVVLLIDFGLKQVWVGSGGDGGGGASI